MIGLLILAILATLVIFHREKIDEISKKMPGQIAEKMQKLWEIAQTSINEKKYLRAEKALLTILRVDERNASAYNRLGILYAKQQAYKDAVECFEIAQSLEPSASSLHNVGLVCFETHDYEKAALAFEGALALDDTLAARHIAYAKVQEKLGNMKKMVAALEKAVELDQNPQTLNFLAEAYEKTNQADLAMKLREQAASLIISHTEAPATGKKARKIVM